MLTYILTITLNYNYLFNLVVLQLHKEHFKVTNQ